MDKINVSLQPFKSITGGNTFSDLRRYDTFIVIGLIQLLTYLLTYLHTLHHITLELFRVAQV